MTQPNDEYLKYLEDLWAQTSSKFSNTTESTQEEIQRAGEAVDALHTLMTEIVSLSTLVQTALSVLLDAAKAEGYSRS